MDEPNWAEWAINLYKMADCRLALRFRAALPSSTTPHHTQAPESSTITSDGRSPRYGAKCIMADVGNLSRLLDC